MWAALLMKGLQMYGANQAGKSAANANKLAQGQSLEQLLTSFTLNMKQRLMATGNAGFANYASFLSEGEYKPGQLNSFSDEALKRVAEKYGVEPTYTTEYEQYLKKRGGLAGLMGGTKLRRREKQVLNREELIAKLEPLAVKPFESRAGQDTIKMYDAFGTPEGILARGKRVQGDYAPTVEAGGQVVKDIFSGQMLQDKLADAQPLFDAQKQQLEGIQDAYDTERAEQLNQMQSYNLANYGAANQGLGQRRLEAQMKMAGAADMASRRGALNVQQEGMKYGLKDAVRNLQLSNPTAGMQMARSQAQFDNFPASQAMMTQAQRMQGFEPFRIQGYQPTNYTPFQGFKPDTTAAGTAGLWSNLFKQGYKQTDGMKGIMEPIKDLFG